MHPSKQPTLSFPIKAMLFDLDDTLYAREEAFVRWADHYLLNTCGMLDEPLRRTALEGIAALDAGGYGSKMAVLQEVCRLYPPVAETGTPEEVARIFYDRFFSQLSLDPDAETVLSALDHAGIPWGIVTNGLSRQWLKLEKMGLTGRSDCLFVSETFGCDKPDPRIFHAAAASLNVLPEVILFVGDNPVNDIQGAEFAGMRTAWLPRSKPWPAICMGSKPDITLSSLLDLLPLIPADET